MNPRRLRSAPLLAVGFALLGCGGTTIEQAGGGSGDDGGSPSSEAGGDDSDGGACTPLPGCSSTTECPAGDGCNTCTCSDGSWGCTLIGCVASCPTGFPQTGFCSDEGQFCPYTVSNSCEGSCTCSNNAWSCNESGSDCSEVACPGAPVNAGDACSVDGQSCSWSSEEGCEGEQCLCDEGAWKCEAMTCPPPICPSTEPQSNTPCDSVGDSCTYPASNGGCGAVVCNCYPAGIWGCESHCEDAGAVPDAN